MPLVWGWYGLEFISCMPRSRSSPSKAVGTHVPLGVPLRTPTKQDPLSESMDAGVPNAKIARLSTSTAFRPVASLNTPYPVTHREASSRYVIQVQIPHAEVLHDVPVRMPHGVRVLPLKPHPFAFFCLCGARLHQLVFFHYVVYGAAAYVFVRQCLGDPSHPRTASPTLG